MLKLLHLIIIILKKKKFNKIGELDGVKITACHEPGYPKNLCLKRFNSHKKLSKKY